MYFSRVFIVHLIFQLLLVAIPVKSFLLLKRSLLRCDLFCVYTDSSTENASLESSSRSFTVSYIILFFAHAHKLNVCAIKYYDPCLKAVIMEYTCSVNNGKLSRDCVMHYFSIGTELLLAINSITKNNGLQKTMDTSSK